MSSLPLPGDIASGSSHEILDATHTANSHLAVSSDIITPKIAGGGSGNNGIAAIGNIESHSGSFGGRLPLGGGSSGSLPGGMSGNSLSHSTVRNPGTDILTGLPIVDPTRIVLPPIPTSQPSRKLPAQSTATTNTVTSNGTIATGGSSSINGQSQSTASTSSTSGAGFSSGAVISSSRTDLPATTFKGGSISPTSSIIPSSAASDRDRNTTLNPKILRSPQELADLLNPSKPINPTLLPTQPAKPPNLAGNIMPKPEIGSTKSDNPYVNQFFKDHKQDAKPALPGGRLPLETIDIFNTNRQTDSSNRLVDPTRIVLPPIQTSQPSRKLPALSAATTSNTGAGSTSASSTSSSQGGDASSSQGVSTSSNQGVSTSSSQGGDAFTSTNTSNNSSSTNNLSVGGSTNLSAAASSSTTNK